MTDIYVPLDYSELKSVIPPGEDILLSSLCKTTISSFGTTTKYTSHVLLTPKHFAYTKPVKKKPAELILIPLYNVWMFAPGAVIISKMPVWSFRFANDPNFETKVNFKERSKKFGYNFLPYLIDAKKDRITEMEANPEEYKEKKISKMKRQLITLEQAYGKNKKKFG